MVKVLTDEAAILAWEDGLGLRDAAKRIGCSTHTLRATWLRLFGAEAYEIRKRERKAAVSAKCRSLGAYMLPGRANPDFNEDYRSVTTQGYYEISTPEWWTGNTRAGLKVLEHRVVCAEKLGLTEIPPGYDVHHIDGDKLNNHPDNLYMMHRFEHARLHMEGRLQEKVQRLSRKGVEPSGSKRPAPSS